MKRAMKRTVIAVIAAACASAFAGGDEEYLDGFVPYAPTPRVSNLLANAVKEAREGRYDTAADLLGLITDSTNPALRAAVTNVMTHDGPFWLALKGAQIRYRLWKPEYYCSRFDLADECQAVLDRYTNTMGHAYCGGIMDIVLMLENFYWMNYDLRNTDAIVQEKLRFDPRGYTHEYVSWRLECGDSTQKLRAVIKQHLDAGGTMHKELSLLDCELIRREGGDAIGSCMAFLARFPKAPITKVLDIASRSLDVDKPETVRKYYQWVVELLARQPQDEAHLETIKYLISEQKKLEMLVPEVLGPRP